MEDILASIRRILSEDEAAAGPPPVVPPRTDDPEVLTLDSSMLVAEPAVPAAPPPVLAEPDPVAPGDDDFDLAEPVAAPEAAVEPDPPVAAEPARPGLVAPEAMEAAASSLSTLVHTLVEHQTMAVHRGGPTLEDIVREEIRPMLKTWLDQNLPPLVERLVSTEIERVIRRAVS